MRIVVVLLACVAALAAVHYFPVAKDQVHHALNADLASKGASSCKVRVDVPRKDRVVYTHALAAIKKGAPKDLHIDRGEADDNRAASLRGIPTWGQLTVTKRKKLDPGHWRILHDRDEYPPAMSDEGGKGADIKYVQAKVNRSAGSVMRSELSKYADGTCFRYRLERK